MKVMAFNGSPRKKWNTASLLKKAMEGAASQGADTRLVHLYDLRFKGRIKRRQKLRDLCGPRRPDHHLCRNQESRRRHPGFPYIFRRCHRRIAFILGAIALSLPRL